MIRCNRQTWSRSKAQPRSMALRYQIGRQHARWTPRYRWEKDLVLQRPANVLVGAIVRAQPEPVGAPFPGKELLELPQAVVLDLRQLRGTRAHHRVARLRR